MSQSFADQLSRLLNEALHETASAADIPSDFVAQIDQAQNRKFGDYQSNAAMILAKQVKKNPRELAAEIIEAIPESNLIETPEIAGPGFINFRITETALDTRLTELLADDTRFGVAKAESIQTIVADFSAPNVAKPMHVGHIRSTIIGDSLTRIGRFLGHKVISDNHIGDWGTQFGMILWGWKNLLNEASMEENPIEELLRIYRDVNAKAKDDKALKETCKNELVKLQGGDEENLQIWERCIELSKTGLQKIYNRLDVNFDHWLGESFYNDQLGPLVEQLLESGIAEESDGAVAVFLRRKLARERRSASQKRRRRVETPASFNPKVGRWFSLRNNRPRHDRLPYRETRRRCDLVYRGSSATAPLRPDFSSRETKRPECRSAVHPLWIDSWKRP